MSKIKQPRLQPQYQVPSDLAIGICIPVYNTVNNNGLAITLFGIENGCDMPYQISVGAGKCCVARNRIKAEKRLDPSIDIVIHMDDDVVLPPHFASKLVSVLLQETYHGHDLNRSEIGAVSAIMLSPKSQPQNELSPDKIPPGTVQVCEPLPKQAPPGTCFAYNRKLTPVEWDIEYQGSQWEDTDGMMQIAKTGRKLVATGNCLILHMNNWSQNEYWETNRARFISKWGEWE